MESGTLPAAPPDRSAWLGAAIAGAGGLLLFISLFLDWYTVPGAALANGALGDVLDKVGGTVGIDLGDKVRDAVHLGGWESFGITDMVCCAAAAVAVVRGLVAVIGESDNPSVPGAMLTAVLGGVALAMIIYRTFNPPYVGLERELGLWIGLFAAGAIVYGSYVALQAGRGTSTG
jgi:hypothetical protein